MFLTSSRSETGVTVQYLFLARLTTLDVVARYGPEFEDPSRGSYEVDRVSLRGDALVSIDLKPSALREFILANRDALLAEVADPGLTTTRPMAEHLWVAVSSRIAPCCTGRGHRRHARKTGDRAPLSVVPIRLELLACEQERSCHQ